MNDPNTQPHVVIIDLGIAELFTARLGRRARLTVVAGTPTHMSPEVWRGNFGPVADIWSLGVVLFELLSGELPFFSSSMNSADEWTRLHRQGPNWALLGRMSTQARALCKRMLSADERMRPTAQQCLGHSWFKEDGMGECGDLLLEDSVGAGPKQIPAPVMCHPLGEKIGEALKGYKARSNFEEVVLLQIASQLHTSQLNKVSEIFKKVDRRRCGIISVTELVSSLRQLGVEEGDAESYATCVDTDDYGNVEYLELAAGCIKLLFESLRGLLWQSFCVIDVVGEGVLNREGVRAVVTRTELVQHGFFPSTGTDSCSSEVEKALDQMNADTNGLISFDEVCRRILPMKPSLPSSRGLKHLIKAAAPATHRLGKAAPMQDEEFAQLLDEIDPVHAELGADKLEKKRIPHESGTPAEVDTSNVREDLALTSREKAKDAKRVTKSSPTSLGGALTGEDDLIQMLAVLDGL